MTDRLDFTNKYNTKLSPDEEKAFRNWTASESKKQGRDLSKDLYDYDLRGFWKNEEGFASNGHGSDKYKKPNHPTFSDESQYHGVDGYQGGKWTEDKTGTSFTPGKTNLKFRSARQLQDYFYSAEPGVKLNLPKSKTSDVVR